MGYFGLFLVLIKYNTINITYYLDRIIPFHTDLANTVINIDIPIFHCSFLMLFKTDIAILFAKWIRYIGLLHSTKRHVYVMASKVKQSQNIKPCIIVAQQSQKTTQWKIQLSVNNKVSCHLADGSIACHRYMSLTFISIIICLRLLYTFRGHILASHKNLAQNTSYLH